MYSNTSSECSRSSEVDSIASERDSLIAHLNQIIAEEPKDLEARLYLLGSCIQSEKYGEFADKLVELRSLMNESPVGWYIEDEVIDEKKIDSVLSEIVANWVEDLAKEDGIKAAQSLVNELLKRDLPAQILDECEVQLAMSYSANKMYQEAIDLMKKQLEKPGPYSKSAILFNIALYYSRLDNKAEALKYAKEAEKAGDKDKAPRLIARLEQPEQHARYYDFVFQLLPRLLPEMGVSEVTANLLMDPTVILKYYETEYNIVVDKDLSEVKAQMITSPRGDIIVWKMPPAEKWTEPMYVAFVPEGDFYRFFTLEKTMDFEGKYEGDPYLLCGSNFTKGDKSASHFNTGEVIDGSTCTPEKFVENIEKFLSR